MKFLALFLLFSGAAFAKDKSQYTYQDGVLEAMHKVVVGSNCNSSGSSTGNISANTNSGGTTNGTVNSTSSGSTNCADEYRWLYTIKAGEQTYVLTPAHSALAPKRGIGALFLQKSTLTNQLPGTSVKVRSDGMGMYVEVGNKETRYEIVSAQ